MPARRPRGPRGTPRYARGMTFSRAACVVLLTGIVGACGGKVGTPQDGGTTSPGGRPPPIETGATPRWFAVRGFSLGMTDRMSGIPGPNAWKSYGFDLDHRNTTAEDSKTSNNSCKRVSGSPSSILAD